MSAHAVTGSFPNYSEIFSPLQPHGLGEVLHLWQDDSTPLSMLNGVRVLKAHPRRCWLLQTPQTSQRHSEPPRL